MSRFFRRAFARIKEMHRGFNFGTILLFALLTMQMLIIIVLVFRTNRLEDRVAQLLLSDQFSHPSPTPLSQIDNTSEHSLPTYVPTRGASTAPVKLIVFSRFSCHYCGEMAAVLDQVVEQYGDQVQIAFRHLPGDSAEDLDLYASMATMCAADQGKFWEMHDQIFHSKMLDMTSLLNHARLIGLDVSQFQVCLISRQHEQEIRNDIADGQKYGVRVLPTLFVNDQKIEGTMSFFALRRLIEDLLSSNKVK